MRIRQDIHGDVRRQMTDRRFRKYEGFIMYLKRKIDASVILKCNCLMYLELLLFFPN